MFKAWAQLVRLPNVFTAPADVIAGAALSYHALNETVLPANLVWLCLMSVCFYAGGMILNDVADVEEDRRERPFRPIPSGRISFRHATLAGFGLLLTGLILGFIQLPESKPLWEGWPFLALFLLIICYNFYLKHTVFGPVVMGLCRGCNLMLGTIMISEINNACYFAAVINTIYITGVTIIASDETRQAKGWKMISGLSLIFLSLGMLVTICNQFSLKVSPHHVIAMQWMSLILVVAAATLWIPIIRNPVPANIGRGIKYSIMGLIVINTIYATLGLGFIGLLVLLLLIPALFLGRFIYST